VPTVTVAVRLILLGVLLDCVPRMVRVVVVVIVWLGVPFATNRASPVPGPVVVESVNVIGIVLLEGLTVAVIVAVLP